MFTSARKTDSLPSGAPNFPWMPATGSTSIPSVNSRTQRQKTTISKFHLKLRRTRLLSTSLLSASTTNTKTWARPRRCCTGNEIEKRRPKNLTRYLHSGVILSVAVVQAERRISRESAQHFDLQLTRAITIRSAESLTNLESGHVRKASFRQGTHRAQSFS